MLKILVRQSTPTHHFVLLTTAFVSDLQLPTTEAANSLSPLHLLQPNCIHLRYIVTGGSEVPLRVGPTERLNLSEPEGGSGDEGRMLRGSASATLG